MSRAALDAFLATLAEEFPRFRVVKKEESPLSRAIDLALRALTLGGQSSFMTRYYTVLGDTVNVASRLESSVAKPGQIAIGPFTYQLVKHKYQCQPVGPVQLKGKQDSIEPYLIVGPHPTSTRSDRQTWTE